MLAADGGWSLEPVNDPLYNTPFANTFLDNGTFGNYARTRNIQAMFGAIGLKWYRTDNRDYSGHSYLISFGWRMTMAATAARKFHEYQCFFRWGDADHTTGQDAYGILCFNIWSPHPVLFDAEL